MIVRHITVVDSYSTTKFHEIINATLVNIASNLSQSLKVVMGKEAAKCLKACYSKFNINIRTSIKWNIFRTFEGDSKMAATLRVVLGFFITIWEYIIQKNDCLLFFIYTNQLSLPVILLLNRFLNKKVIFTFHGELELQRVKVTGFRLSRLYRWIYKMSLKHMSKKSNAIFLVLGDSIRKNLISIYPESKHNIITIYHPYYFVTNHCSPICLGKKLIVGTIGTLNESKGLNDVVKIINGLETEIKAGGIEFRVLGRVLETDLHKLSNAIVVNKGFAIDMSRFRHEIENLDFILYCYPQDSYRLTASGAIMDAIISNKPIITFGNDFFDSILADCTFGYRIKDTDDAIALLKDFVTSSVSKRLVCNYSPAIEKISVNYNTTLLKESLSAKGITFLS